MADKQGGNDAHQASSDQKFGVAAPQLSLPKGGGAVRGIGEKFTANPEPKNILAKDIYLYVPASVSVSITGTQGGNNISFGPGKPVGTMKLFVSNDEAPMGNLKITIHDTTTVIDKMWLLERYVLS